jgi:hypothetical protein
MQVSTDTGRVGVRSTRRALAVRAIGPLCAAAGFAWALFQPYRITLLHPYGQGIWWLISEPPLYVVLVGLLFHWLVAPGLLDDLEEAERERSGPP